MIHLSTIVATGSLIPAALAISGRHALPRFITLTLAHIAGTGLLVSIAASPWLAQHTTGLLGKVRAGCFASNSAGGSRRGVGVPGLVTGRVLHLGGIHPPAQTPQGTIKPLNLSLLWPYHAALRTKLALQRAVSDEPAWNAVTPHYFIGAW